MTAEDLVQELTPKGRAEVPAAVKVCAEFLLNCMKRSMCIYNKIMIPYSQAELLQRIRKYLGTVDTKAEKK